jgi:hypothetical protein
MFGICEHPRFVGLGGSNKPFSKKAQNLCDVTQCAYAECQVTKHINILAMNLVTLKCQYIHGSNSVVSELVVKFFYDFGMASLELSFISICTSLFFNSYLD